MNKICRYAVITLLLSVPYLCHAESNGSTAANQPVAQAALPIVPAEQKSIEPAKAEKAVKFGYLDMVRVGSDSSQGKAAKAKFEVEAGKYKGQIVAKQKQLEKQKTAIQAKLATMSPEQRAVKAKEFEKKVSDYQKFVQKAEKEMQELQEDVSGKLFHEIEQAVNAYGKANGFTAIYVKKDLLYLASGVDVQDVTDPILALVNEKGQKK